MIKKCIGCGIKLQNENEEKEGYTPKIEKDLCMRCFKLKNYGKVINNGKIQNNEELIKKINNSKGYVLFLVDYLNIYSEVIDIYKKIKCNKSLVITKSDLIPKNIIIKKMINNIKNIYEIKEEILLVNNKKHDEVNEIINKYNKILFVGFTNMGKSSLINNLTNNNITVSNKKNTTQEFISIEYENKVLIDCPGFISNTYKEVIPKKIVKPITEQVKNKYYLKIANINIASEVDNNFTIYMDNYIDISKRKINESLDYNVIAPSKSDLVIKGLGFITIQKITKLSINIAKKYYEIRPSIIGGNNE